LRYSATAEGVALGKENQRKEFEGKKKRKGGLPSSDIDLTARPISLRREKFFQRPISGCVGKKHPESTNLSSGFRRQDIASRETLLKGNHIYMRGDLVPRSRVGSYGQQGTGWKGSKRGRKGRESITLIRTLWRGTFSPLSIC